MPKIKYYYSSNIIYLYIMVVLLFYCCSSNANKIFFSAQNIVYMSIYYWFDSICEISENCFNKVLALGWHFQF